MFIIHFQISFLNEIITRLRYSTGASLATRATLSRLHHWAPGLSARLRLWGLTSESGHDLNFWQILISVLKFDSWSRKPFLILLCVTLVIFSLQNWFTFSSSSSFVVDSKKIIRNVDNPWFVAKMKLKFLSLKIASIVELIFRHLFTYHLPPLFFFISAIQIDSNDIFSLSLLWWHLIAKTLCEGLLSS